MSYFFRLVDGAKKRMLLSDQEGLKNVTSSPNVIAVNTRKAATSPQTFQRFASHGPARTDA
jgi:3-deoxy-D-arabino-heptulosonate 7-phosphate (DAHP) synthase